VRSQIAHGHVHAVSVQVARIWIVQ
jgi:hypothetical protein